MIALRARTRRAAYLGLVPDALLAGLDDGPEEIARSVAMLRTADPGCVNLVAVDGRRLTGFAMGGPASEPSARSGTAELQAIYVDPDHWGDGTGTALLDTALSLLSTAGFRRVGLWTLSGNARAVAFCRRHGFLPAGETRTRPTLNAEEIRMVRRLR